MKRPKENPEDKKARLTERRMTEIERRAAAEESAARLGSDLRAVYGFRAPSLFGQVQR